MTTRSNKKLSATTLRIVKHYTVTNHPQAAELRQWLLRTVRKTTKNGTNTKTGT